MRAKENSNSEDTGNGGQQWDCGWNGGQTLNGGRLMAVRLGDMLVELAKPVALLLCLLSLCAVFHTAFLIPASDLHQRIWDSLELLSLAAGISVMSGLIFRESATENSADSARFTATLPVQVFFWGAGSMLLLFVASWYLESHCIFYRDVRF
ncbi:MAG: hypothetical protein ABI380_02815 [Edaphobacter sp.]